MFQLDITKELLGFKEENIKKVNKFNDKVEIEVEIPKKEHVCPVCGHSTSYVHDYKIRTINHGVINHRQIIILYNQRRYVCKKCNKRFAEKNDFVARYYRISKQVVLDILNELKEMISFKYIAKQHSLSGPTIARIFNLISYSPPKSMPRVVCIDEFKGNAGEEKYQCILANPETGEIIDILPTRKLNYLISYFKSCDCSKTEIFISDMYKNYKDIHKTFFKNAKFVVDKYHYVRQTTFAFERIRKEVQQDFSTNRRIYFKHSRRLLLKKAEDLNEEQYQQVRTMLLTSPKLDLAYQLKELMYKAMKQTDANQFKNYFKFFIIKAQSTELKPFHTVATTYMNWQEGILNSRLTKYTNGFVEGMNNRIKVLKRIGYGYRNFERFRNRIMHLA